LAIQVLADLRARGIQADLTFIGPHPPSDQAALIRVATDLKVLERVRFLGRVSDRELVTLYRTAITLAISTVEGFGLPPVEALLAGGQVVATPSPIYIEVLASAAVYATGHDPGSIADAILAATNASTDVQTQAAHLAERYSPRNAADSLVAVYQAVLDQ
jgi:glycosyltransferase involved in cell wall biosynthesis